MPDHLRCKGQHLHLQYSTSPRHSALSSSSRCCYLFSNWQIVIEAGDQVSLAEPQIYHSDVTSQLTREKTTVTAFPASLH